jgi:hypothetical protein
MKAGTKAKPLLASTFCLLLVSIVPGEVCAQIAAASPRVHVVAPDMYKIVAEGNRHRVMEVTMRPGQRDPPHSHPEGTAVYFLTDCTLKVTQYGVDVDTYPSAGNARTYAAISSHSTLNVGKADCRMVFFEPQ